MIRQSFSLLIRIIGKGVIKQNPRLKKLTISMLVFLFVFSTPGFAFAIEEIAGSVAQAVAPVNDSSAPAETTDNNSSASVQSDKTETDPSIDKSEEDMMTLDEEDPPSNEEKKPIENKLRIDKDNSK